MDGGDVQLAGLRGRGLPIPLTLAERRGWLEQFNRIPAIGHAGITVGLDDGQLVHVVLAQLAEHHLGGLQVRAVNGAVLAGLLDCALGVAGTVQFPGKRAGTCELSLKFMRGVFETPVDVFATCVKRTGTLAFVESELYSAGKLCSLASGIVSVATDRGEEPIW